MRVPIVLLFFLVPVVNDATDERQGALLVA